MRYRYVEDYEDYSEPRPPDGECSDPCECGGVIDYWDCGDQSWDDPGTHYWECRDCGEGDRC